MRVIAADTSTVTFTPTRARTITPSVTPTRTQRPTPMATRDYRILNPANQHLYYFADIQVSWNFAKSYCVSRGGHLVTIHDDPENTFVYKLAGDGAWLGATQVKPGSWQWVTGEPLTFTKFGIGGKPKDPTRIYLNIFYQNYVGAEGYNWGSVGESNTGTIICEWDTASP